MCKHILFNDFDIQDIQTLKDFVSLTYDNDGFGAIIRTETNAIETIKNLDSQIFYIDLIERITRGDIQTLVVHHRTSTNSPGIEYAHPFEFQGNYLTHNGVVSMPGEYATNTKNDSEKLLHHLISTDFETKSIEGYYSCFILNSKETIVLVDKTAPIYTNGRIYSSHKLSDEFIKLEASICSLDPFTGEIRSHKEIEIAVSTYGRNLSHLSLGTPKEYKWDGKDWNYVDADIPATDEISVNVTEFFDSLTESEENKLNECESGYEIGLVVDQIAWCLGMSLTENERELICSYCRDIAA